MTTHVVADDVLGKIARKQWELQRRLMEGSLDPFLVSLALQQVVEGNFIFDDFFSHLKQFLLPLDKQLEKIRFHNDNTWDGAIPEEFIDQVNTSSNHQQSVTDLEILHVEGHSPDHTIAMLWAAIGAETPCLKHRITMRSVPVSFHTPELLPSSRILPNIKRVRLNLVAYWGNGAERFTTKEIRDQAHSTPLAHGEVLSALAWHPGLIHRMDGKTFPFMDLAGYDLRPNEEMRIPYIWRNKAGEVELCDWHGTEYDSKFSVPVLLSPVP